MVPREELLAEQLAASVAHYARRNAVVRRAFWSARVGVLALGAAATVLLGVRVGNPGYIEWSRNLALGFSAAATFLTGLSAFWNLESYWMLRKAGEHRLRLLAKRVEYARSAAEGLSAERVDGLFEEYLSILGELGDYWAAQVEPVSSEQRGS